MNESKLREHIDEIRKKTRTGKGKKVKHSIVAILVGILVSGSYWI